MWLLLPGLGGGGRIHVAQVCQEACLGAFWEARGIMDCLPAKIFEHTSYHAARHSYTSACSQRDACIWILYEQINKRAEERVFFSLARWTYSILLSLLNISVEETCLALPYLQPSTRTKHEVYPAYYRGFLLANTHLTAHVYESVLAYRKD